MARIDMAAFRQHEEDELVTCRAHPKADLLVWNYTPKCMYAHAWDEVTLQARGLITDLDGVIVSRPFRKFFNWGEGDPAPSEPFTVTVKMDGSLAISYVAGGIPYLATRGSFVSNQAVKATDILHSKYKDFLPTMAATPQYTYLFEVIYPQNMIVVNYQGMEDLVLLAVIETETGKEQDIHASSWPFPVVAEYNGATDIATLAALEETNKEGFVVHFAGGTRMKVKFAEYVKLHRLFTQLSNLVLWEALRDGTPMAQLLGMTYDALWERAPQYYEWVKMITRELSSKYEHIARRVESVYKDVTRTTTMPAPTYREAHITASDVEKLAQAMRKRIKERFAEYPDIQFFLFMKYNGDKPEEVRRAIWKSLRPTYSRPYLVDEEAGTA